MTRAAPDQDPEYARNRAFVLAFAAFLDAMPRPPTTTVGHGNPDGTITYREVPNTAPNLAAALARGLEEVEQNGARAARTGMRLGLQDMLEMSRDLSPTGVAEADRWLAAQSLPTLTAMRLRVWRTIPKVIARGRIRTEAEYYLLIERLNDVDDTELSAQQRERLNAMVAEFEQRPKRGKSGRRPPAA